MASSANSSHTRTSASGSSERTVEASMSTVYRAVRPSRVRTTAACRHRRTGCDGTMNPAT